MRIKNRLNPYPILDNYGDDYIDSSFSVKYHVSIQFSEVYGKLIFLLKNEEIMSLIKQEKAVYVVHVECPSTCYRTVLTSTESEVEFKINISYLSNVIEIRTFIILTDDIDKYFSRKFHPDFQNQCFYLKKNQILAIGTAKNYNVQEDDKKLEALPSILRIVKLEDKKKGTLSVNTDSNDHVIIGLSKDVYDLYARLGKSTFNASSFSLVLLPALIVVLQRMCIYKEDDSVNSMHWYQVIEQVLNNNGFNIDDLSIENDTLLAICQSVFADPIARSFKELDARSERMQ